MITEKDTIKCEAVFNDNRTHRYLCKRVWNKDKPCIAVIMLNPCLRFAQTEWQLFVCALKYS